MIECLLLLYLSLSLSLLSSRLTHHLFLSISHSPTHNRPHAHARARRRRHRRDRQGRRRGEAGCVFLFFVFSFFRQRASGDRTRAFLLRPFLHVLLSFRSSSCSRFASRPGAMSSCKEKASLKNEARETSMGKKTLVIRPFRSQPPSSFFSPFRSSFVSSTSSSSSSLSTSTSVPRLAHHPPLFRRNPIKTTLQVSPPPSSAWPSPAARWPLPRTRTRSRSSA